DIAALAEQCGFRDCRHMDEPGCAVLEAIDSGEMAEGRLVGFRKLQREIAAEGRRRDVRARRAFSRNWERGVRAAANIRKRAKGLD
ncbi:MAG: ribosome small subunit-dependent GTPase A, partial [Myxococcota bacterium]